MTDTHLNYPEDMDGEELISFLHNLVFRTSMHNLLWFDEAAKRLSYDEALELENKVHERLTPITRRRLYRFFSDAGLPDLPVRWSGLPQEDRLGLADAISKNWLAQDGVWFQAIESAHGMTLAKAVNDAAWGRFSPLEASCVRHFLGLSETPGLEGLARALHFRLYARFNAQKTYFKDGSLYLEIVNCRVQHARNRKHMEDYPCKSAGIVEYTTFASTLDPRITTTCVACPPDKHPADWYCCWKFDLLGAKWEPDGAGTQETR